MKHITYNHTSHADDVSSGSVFQEILSCFIISIICDIKVVYHDSWKHCRFITYDSFQKNTTKPLDKYDNIININNYLKWESLSFDDLMDIKNIISQCVDNTLIVLSNVCLINPSFLYKWYKDGLLDKNYYTELFLPRLREGKRFYYEGLTIDYYTNIIKLINSVSDIKINIMYEGDSDKTTINPNLSSCYTNQREGYNHLWCRELGKLPNVILNEGDLDNLDKQINELCNSKYLLLSPSTFAYYSGMISNGIKFVDKKIIDLHNNALRNTVDMPSFVVYDNFEDML